MQIYKKDGELLLDVVVDDTSYRHRAIMDEDSLVLYFSTAVYVEIPVGAYCDFEGGRYTLLRPQALTMNHKRSFEYTVTMESPQAMAKIWKFRNPVDGRLKFPLTAKPHEHLQMFVDNMNRRDTGWEIGTCIEGTETLVNYDHAYCWEALTQMADALDTEFSIVGKVVSLGKVEQYKSNPLPLSYGKGNGFVSGITRTNYEDNPPVEILYAQGGSQNIDRSRYGAGELHLPTNGFIQYDGKFFEDEEGYNADIAYTYQADELGYSVSRVDGERKTYTEDSLDCSDIYPKRVGTATQAIVVNEAKNLYDFVDDTIPDTLNYEDYLISDETMTVIFQSGMLAGREFEVKYIHEPKGGKLGKRFEIVPQEEDGEWMPNETFRPNATEGVLDTYAIFHVMLPDAYINAHESEGDPKEGAEWDMMREAVRYLYEHEQQNFTFNGILDGIWAKKNWSDIADRLCLGGYVLFSDTQFQQEGVKVRIIGIKDYINNPHSPEVELSNGTVGGSLSSSLKSLESRDVQIEDNHEKALQFTKRTYRNAQETIEALKLAMEGYSAGINPVSVQTMAMLVGDESLQFRFVVSKEDLTQIACPVAWNSDTRVLTCASTYLQHMTLGITSITYARDPSAYKVWSVEGRSFDLLDKASSASYLYVFVPFSTDEAGTWKWESEPLAGQTDTGYNLLVGILSNLYSPEATFTPVYGFTEIYPGRIATDRIVSTDGNTYFDLMAGEIGGKIKFLTDDNTYETLVEGGKIKTEFLDVNNVTAGRVLVGDDNGRHVLIEPDEVTQEGRMAVYDEQGNECLQIEGNKYTEMEDMFGDVESGDVDIAIRTETCYGYDAGITMGTGYMQVVGSDEGTATRNETIVISDTFYTYIPTEIAIGTGAVVISVVSQGYVPSVIGEPRHTSFVTVQWCVETYSDEAMTQFKSRGLIAKQSYQAQATSRTATAGNDSIDLTGKSVRVTYGYHRIVAIVSLSAPYSGDSATFQWGGYALGKYPITASYNTQFFMSRYFANGFCLGEHDKKYMAVYSDGVFDRMNMLFENKNVGFRVTSKVQGRFKTDRWMPIPILLYKTTYQVNLSKGAVSTVADVKSFTDETLSAGYVSEGSSTGYVRLTITDAWRSYLTETELQQLSVFVSGRNAAIDARVTAKTADEIIVYLTGAGLAYDNPLFDIVIMYL